MTKYMLHYRVYSVDCYTMCYESTVQIMKDFIRSIGYTTLVATWKIKPKQRLK